jgi:hypothetical protein
MCDFHGTLFPFGPEFMNATRKHSRKEYHQIPSGPSEPPEYGNERIYPTLKIFEYKNVP